MAPEDIARTCPLPSRVAIERFMGRAGGARGGRGPADRMTAVQRTIIDDAWRTLEARPFTST
jgi:hypothetical protein